MLYNIILTNVNMRTHKCCKNQRTNFQVKQRYIPTFVHQQIFDNEPLKPHLSKCTPTFHSTVLDTEGYNIKTIHHKTQKEPVRPNTALQKTMYCNVSHQKKIQALYPTHHCLNYSRNDWFDHTKQQMFHSIKSGINSGYSKERKYLDLSSDPVFTDFTYGTKANLPFTNVYHKKCCEGTPQVCQVPCIQSVQNQTVPKIINNPPIPQPQLPISQLSAQQLIKVQGQNKNIQAEAMCNKCQPSTKKDFHKNCIPKREKQLMLKGKHLGPRPQPAHKSKIVSENPTFTVVRRNRVNCW